MIQIKIYNIKSIYKILDFNLSQVYTSLSSLHSGVYGYARVESVVRPKKVAHNVGPKFSKYGWQDLCPTKTWRGATYTSGCHTGWGGVFIDE